MIAVEEVLDLLITPDYPFTGPNGVATFVHITEPLLPEEPEEQEIRDAFLKVKNQVSIC